MVTDHTNDHSPDDGEDYYGEAAYVATEEIVLFSSDDVLLDSQASAMGIFSQRSGSTMEYNLGLLGSRSAKKSSSES